MVRDRIFSAIASALLLVLLLPIGSSPVEADILLRYDLDQDDGGLTHFGTFDVWEWGRPDGGSSENPGPEGAAEGDGCWGSPLNSTYETGSNCYLVIPVLEGTTLASLTLSFLCWYDLTLYEIDEVGEMGTAHSGDSCSLEVSNDGHQWITVETYKNDTDFLWVLEEIDLSEHLGDEVFIRFHLKDNGDGFQDNGFFIDSLTLEGVSKPAVSIALEPLRLPGIAPMGEWCRFEVVVLNNGLMVPDDTFLNVTIMGPLGDNKLRDTMLIDESEVERHEVMFTPYLEGNYTVTVSLFVDGNLSDQASGSIRSRSALFLEDVDSMYGWSTNRTGDVGWNIHDTPSAPPSPSGNSVFWFGDEQGLNGGPGFQGPGSSLLESDWIDLTEMRSAELYMYHFHDFGGIEGSCGGTVLALTGTTWEVIVPEEGYDIDLHGWPGEDSFSGYRDWTLVRFDLDGFIGNFTRIRFLSSSSEEGKGLGWFIDDIIIVGEEREMPDIEPPASIEGLSTSFIEEGEVRVDWYQSAALDFSHYNIYLETGYFGSTAGLTPYSTIMDRDQNTFIISGLERDTVYWVMVTAVDLSGNERRSVNPLSFEPTDGGNLAPVAIIDVEGSSLRRVGESITLSGSRSYDPDGDELNYTWSFPDGSSRSGRTVIWRPLEYGERVVRLSVDDGRGLSATDTVTFIISDPSGDARTGGLSISDYMKIILPIFLLFLIVILLLAYLGQRRKRKIERKLERAGIDSGSSRRYWRGDHTTVHAEEVDLIPVLKKSERGKGDDEDISDQHPAGPPRRWTAPPPPVPTRAGSETRPKGKPSPVEKSVGVVLECPTCTETFRMRVSRRALDRGDDIELMCPHCGYRGSIND